MMKTTKARVTFNVNGGHKGFLAFSSGNSAPWLAVYAQNTVLANTQRLGNVTVEKVSDDVCDITAPQWSMLVIIPLSGTIEIADAQPSVSRTTVKYEVWAQSFEIEMPMESIAICLCGLRIATIWRSSSGIYMSDFPANYSGEKTANGVKLKYAAGESAWAAIVVAQPSVSQSPVHFFNTEGSKGDVTLTFSSAARAVALIITDGNGRGSSMMYVSGLSKYINKLAGDSSPSWSEDGSALTLKSTDWNNIIVVTGTSVEFSVAP